MTRNTACGLALALGLFTAHADQQTGTTAKAQGEKIDAQAVAPAQQLGKAFAEVAAHVQPAVVSVYSEKMVKRTESGADEFLRPLFW